jgi:hydrogenase 3 maturation protease
MLLFRKMEVPILLVGIGNTLKSDDAAGVALVEKLRSKGFQNRKDITIMDCGQSPENFINEIVNSDANTVILIDAANTGRPAGSYEVFKAGDISGLSCSTHSMPLSMLAEMITMRSRKKVFLLGIQPKSLEFGEKLSIEVKKGIEDIAETLKCMNWE